MANIFLSSILSASLLLTRPAQMPVAGFSGQLIEPWVTVLASEILDLSQRYPVESVNEGFKENILVNLSYFKKINNGRLILRPNEVFTFHNQILPEFKKEKIITQESTYSAKDGYKLVAGLYGNGVCHLASVMNWVATEAGLEVTALVNHDFAPVAGVDQKYGTSIKYSPNIGGTAERQNLYIRNTKDYPVEFIFILEGENLRFSILTAGSTSLPQR